MDDEGGLEIRSFTNWNVDTIFNVLDKYQTSTTSLKKRAAPAPPSGTGRAKGVEVSTD